MAPAAVQAAAAELVFAGKALPVPNWFTMNAWLLPKARSVVNPAVAAGAEPKAGCVATRVCSLTKATKSVGAELLLFGPELVEPEPELPELPPDVDETGGPLSEPPQAANVSQTAAMQ
jgi:hypothetical protein